MDTKTLKATQKIIKDQFHMHALVQTFQVD